MARPGRKTHTAAPHPLRTWAGRILDIILLLLLVAAFLFARSEDPDKTLFGYRIYLVLSNSMEPELPEGGVVVVQQAPPTSLQVGDDITFHTSDEEHQVITHRIVEIIDDYEGSGLPGFVTQGIARSTPDNDVRPAESVLGRVVLCIPLLGYLLAFFQSDWFFYLLLVLIAASVFFLLRKVWKN